MRALAAVEAPFVVVRIERAEPDLGLQRAARVALRPRRSSMSVFRWERASA